MSLLSSLFSPSFTSAATRPDFSSSKAPQPPPKQIENVPTPSASTPPTGADQELARQAGAVAPKRRESSATAAMLVVLVIILIMVGIGAYFAIRAFQGGIGSALEEITGGVNTLATIAANLITQLGVIISGILNFLDTIVSDLDTALTVVSNGIVGAISAIGTAIQNNIVPFINSFGDIFNSVIDNITTFWNDHILGIVSAVNNAVTSILNALGL